MSAQLVCSRCGKRSAIGTSSCPKCGTSLPARPPDSGLGAVPDHRAVWLLRLAFGFVGGFLTLIFLCVAISQIPSPESIFLFFLAAVMGVVLLGPACFAKRIIWF